MCCCLLSLFSECSVNVDQGTDAKEAKNGPNRVMVESIAGQHAHGADQDQRDRHEDYRAGASGFPGVCSIGQGGSKLVSENFVTVTNNYKNSKISSFVKIITSVIMARR